MIQMNERRITFCFGFSFWGDFGFFFIFILQKACDAVVCLFICFYLSLVGCHYYYHHYYLYKELYALYLLLFGLGENPSPSFVVNWLGYRERCLLLTLELVNCTHPFSLAIGELKNVDSRRIKA
ncbi:hypothetical protein V8C35DRAFT_19302 [Trichoderma chlorosporum]